MTSNPPAPFAVRLPTLRWGAPDARPAALLLHGLGSSAGTWWRVASALAEAGWSVTAPDLRGHGASPRTTRYALADHAADVAALIPSHDGPWDLVIGHSLGGAVATVTAEAHARWARALLLVDPVFSVLPSDVEALVADLLGDLDQTDPAALLQKNPRWQLEDAVQKANAVRLVSAFVIEHTVRDNSEWQLEPVAARIPASVAVRVLAADPALGASFSAAEGDRLTVAAGDFGYTVVAGAGHSVQRDDPERVVAEALRLVG
ncbi:alpha/beta fold hydrolase [Herbiconiux daphne]|uniref:Alpha/beta hydrolase n=1 Tax=Herbiconiux daphne TaxID=2970914 RepID=A0ABT2GYE2_9MICO|nr:alpha/beta hydrolase [Herbiconiux daphne]MCS5732978.1 alpha/beta hydrolase [Herbiconiux daphne]